MLYGCLTPSLLPVLAFWLFVSCGWLGGIAYVAGLVAMTWLVRWRHHWVVRQEGALVGITKMRIRRGRGFVTPGELPWYRGWSSYDLEADDPEGFRREYMADLTWTWFGLAGITASFRRSRTMTAMTPAGTGFLRRRCWENGGANLVARRRRLNRDGRQDLTTNGWVFRHVPGQGVLSGDVSGSRPGFRLKRLQPRPPSR